MQSLYHENFIQLIGYCKDNKKLHLVTEFFDGQSLYDIIFDDDLKEVYNFNIDKKKRYFCTNLLSRIVSI